MSLSQGNQLDAQSVGSEPNTQLSSQVLQDRFRVGPRLGSGATGTVFLGWDAQQQRPVAIKVLHRELSLNQRAVRRFAREAELLSRLQHDAIMPLLTSFQFRHHHYLVMPWARHGSLEHLMRRERRVLPLQLSLQVGIRLAAALGEIHRLGVVHRDLKPGNVLLNARLDPVLSDFGMAAFVGLANSSEPGSAGGSLAYMSPEVLHGQLATEASDYWSLGVLLFELVSSRKPFGEGAFGETIHAILQRQPLDLQKLRPDVPTALVQLIEQLLNKLPRKRLCDAQRVRAVLTQVIEQLSRATQNEFPIWQQMELEVLSRSEVNPWRSDDAAI